MKAKTWMKLILPVVLIAMLTGIGINDGIREIPGASITASAVNPVTSGDYRYFVNADDTVTVAGYVGSGGRCECSNEKTGRKQHSCREGISFIHFFRRPFFIPLCQK